MDSDAAKSLAHAMVARSWAERDRMTLRLPPAFVAIEPGSRLTLALSPPAWTVDRLTIEGFVVIAELKPWWQPSPVLASDPGRVLSSPDVVAVAPTLELVELPQEISGETTSGLSLMLAASSPSPAWRSAAVTVSAGGREFLTATPRRKSVIGIAENILGGGQPFLLDEEAQVTVALVDPEQWLESCDLDALSAGMNLVMIGDELVQFRSAVPLGGGRFALSGLLRGRGGTEFAIAGHVAGERLVLIDPARLTRIQLPSSTIGASAEARTDGLLAASSDPLVIIGENLRPPAPVRLSATVDVSGVSLGWVRRSRAGWGWPDDMDAPLGEAREAYRVTMTGTAGSVTFECQFPSLVIAVADLAPLGRGAGTIEVRQIGDRALSRPASLSINLN